MGIPGLICRLEAIRVDIFILGLNSACFLKKAIYIPCREYWV